jgi:uncharacterized protein involved in tellurium resistance
MFTIKEKVVLTQNMKALLPKNFKQVMVSLSWTSAIDFDLFAVYESKQGKLGIVYFNDLGNLNSFPYIKLSGDEGVNDKAGDNEESLLISSLSEMKYIWICTWDYEKVLKNQVGRFDTSDIKATVVDDSNNEITIPLVDQKNGNTALIFTIYCSSAITSEVINNSNVTTLNGLNPNVLVEFLKNTVKTMV